MYNKSWKGHTVRAMKAGKEIESSIVRNLDNRTLKKYRECQRKDGPKIYFSGHQGMLLKNETVK